MSKEAGRFWITKYALTEGIFERDCTFGSDGETYVYPKDNRYFASFKVGQTAFRSRADANKNSENQRKKKIASLKKQIQKLEALKF